MKLTKHANKNKSRIVSFAAVIALILCTVLSLGLIMPDRYARAEDEPTKPAAQVAEGIRFVQVAAGYDFAIGLTYDRKLYGWSTKKADDRAQNPQTLGDYYSDDPTEINVVFRKGPQGQFKWNATGGNDNYHAERKDDRIKSIAATGTTAAFVTEKGYIYTWGADTAAQYDVTHNDKAHYLLLRDVDESNYSWKVPYIIDYHYYGATDGATWSTEQMIPSNDSYPTSLAAGEFNYIFMFVRNYPSTAPSGWPTSVGDYYHTYVWGSMLYNAVNTIPKTSFSYSNTITVESNDRKIFNTFVTYMNSNSSDVVVNGNQISVVAGGYTVGINNTTANVSGGTSLQLRGRNFITSQGVTVDGSNYGVTNTTQVLDSASANISWDGKTISAALAGGVGRDAQNGSLYGVDTEKYYARQASDDVSSYSISGREASVLINSNGDPIANTLAPTRYAVSLGNDIGYGISEGKLFGWGDNEYGQLVGLTTDTTTVTNKNEPTQLLSTVTNFVSVAAGKQQSKNNRAFQGSTAGNTLVGTTFAAGAKNDDKYISAALTQSGEIYAWSNGISNKTLTYKDYTGNKKESFAAIYSGYGNHLYAVTASGKLVHITVNSAGNGFVQEVYDKFYDKTGTEIKNWEVDSNNRVEFKPSAAETQQNPAPEFDTATFYVWSSNVLSASPQPAEGEEPKVNTVITNGAAKEFKPFVSQNRIGDAYRIVGYKPTPTSNRDNEITYLSKGGLVDGDYSPKFYFLSVNNNITTESEMSPAQQQNMFDFAVVYDSNGVGLRIKPLQSSKGRDIRVDFYIVRYNNYKKYTGTDDNAIYYDYEKCSLTFKIADTPSVITYNAHITDGDNNPVNSNIPLLDPNNSYNTKFSLAVQNVSTGVDELIKFLTENPNTVNTDFKTAVLTQMRDNDAGFPDSRKVSLGNLDYYLNATDLAKYNDVYRFMFTDRDSDRVTLTRYGVGGTGPIITGNGVSGDIKNITVTVPVADYLGSGFTGKSAKEIERIISTDFDNKYGLYDFSIADGNLTFKYDVVMFTATGSSGTIKYNGDNSAATRVNGYVTAPGQSVGARASFYANTLNDYNYDAEKGYVSTNKTAAQKNASEIAYVYSQPTLRLKSDLNGVGQVVDVNGQVSGTKNTFVKNFNNDLYVGDSTEILLSDYVDFAAISNIFFTHNNSSTESALKEFSDQFEDKTGHVKNDDNSARAGARVVWLEGNKITVHPTTASPINITVAVQRFADAGRTRYFTNDNKPDEKIFLTFNFNNIIGFEIKPNADFKVGDGGTVKENTAIELFGSSGLIDIEGQDGRSVSAGALSALQANARIYDVKSSESGKSDVEQLFSYSVVDNNKIVITPKRSGTGALVFSVNIYNKSLSFTQTINVSCKTEMGTVIVKDSLSIPVSTITDALVDANSFNKDINSYKILTNDVKNPDVKNNNEKQYNAIYFTDKEGNTGNPPFIQNVVFEKSGATLRIIPSNSTVVKSDTYYMHVKFINTEDGYTSYENVPAKSIIEVIIPVVSGKVKLQDAEGGNLVTTIDCRHPQDNTWWTTTGEKLETKASIPISYLLDRAGTEEPESYKIFLISADSAAAQYFQYDKGNGDKAIIITPKDNTPKNFELNVSVYSGTITRVLSFEVSVKGIVTTLPVMTDDEGTIGYGNIWLYSAAIVFGVLFIIFMIRFIVYIRRRSKQRAIIKRNQELIRLRDRMHGKANAASREQLVKSKLKMEDPKYAKMFNEMRKDKEEDTGVALVNSDLAATADKKTKKNKKKGGKKTVAELKAELAAKKAAFAATQGGGAQPVNPFATEVPIDGGFVAPDGGYGAPDGGYGSPDGGYGAPDGGYGAPEADFGAQNIDGNDIIFDASDMGDGNM